MKKTLFRPSFLYMACILALFAGFAFLFFGDEDSKNFEGPSAVSTVADETTAERASINALTNLTKEEQYESFSNEELIDKMLTAYHYGNSEDFGILHELVNGGAFDNPLFIEEFINRYMDALPEEKEQLEDIIYLSESDEVITTLVSHSLTAERDKQLAALKLLGAIDATEHAEVRLGLLANLDNQADTDIVKASLDALNYTPVTPNEAELIKDKVVQYAFHEDVELRAKAVRKFIEWGNPEEAFELAEEALDDADEVLTEAIVALTNADARTQLLKEKTSEALFDPENSTSMDQDIRDWLDENYFSSDLDID